MEMNHRKKRKTKVENYSSQDILPYLKSLAYNIDF